MLITNVSDFLGKELNWNLIVFGVVIIIIVALMVFTGRHRIKINGIMEAETNLPESKDEDDGNKVSQKETGAK